jgi:hypothetical protein
MIHQFPVILLGFFAIVFPLSTEAMDFTPDPYNRLVLDAVKSMPEGGLYSASSTANKGLFGAVEIIDGRLHIDASHAKPSYCSGATYLVFLKVLSRLQEEHRIQIPPPVLDSLPPAGQPDGSGVWGRWNANGPGTARLFHELDLGRNFTDPTRALPGDFLKIFWNDGIGATEHGHSVIFLGLENTNGAEHLRFWSSNIPGGYGERSVPMTRIHRMIFSRLESPQNITGPIHTRTDAYLSSLQRKSSSPSEMAFQCGLNR